MAVINPTNLIPQPLLPIHTAMHRLITPLLLIAAACAAPLHAGTELPPPVTPPPPATTTFGGPFLERSKLTGDWGGLRDDLAAHGLTIDLNAVYTFHGVIDGGTELGHSTGNLLSWDVAVTLDTDKAGLWPGGFFKVRMDGKTGTSVQQRTATISPVNNDLVSPNVEGRLGQSAWAITELSYTQFLSEQFGITLGLLNTSSGDENPIAGSMNSNQQFLNAGFLYSANESAVIPMVALGGGLIFIPSKNFHGSFVVVGATESAGYNPFDKYEGTSFSTEWTFTYELGERPGGMTVGGIYSIDRPRTNFGSDARLFFGSVLLTGAVPTTDEEAWCVYWNGYQYLQGNEEDGWGVFARFGLGDGKVNPIRYSMATGVGGTSPFSGRNRDRWGLGVYYLEFESLPVLNVLNIDNEVGAELFYNLALTPWANLTFDVQVVNSPAPNVNTAVVVGVRLGIAF